MSNKRKNIKENIKIFFDDWKNKTRHTSIIDNFAKIESLILWLISVDTPTRMANGKWLGETLVNAYGKPATDEIRDKMHSLAKGIQKAEYRRVSPDEARKFNNDKFKEYRKKDNYKEYQRAYHERYRVTNRIGYRVRSRIHTIANGFAHAKHPAIARKVMEEIAKFKSKSDERYSIDHILPVSVFVSFGVSIFSVISDPINLRVISKVKNSVKGANIIRQALRIAKVIEKKHNLPGFGSYVADLYAKQQAEKEEVIETIVYNKNKEIAR